MFLPMACEMRPFDHFACLGIHVFADGLRNRGVMVSLHRNRAVGNVFHHGVDHPARIGAVADKVTQKGITLGTALFGMRETGRERFTVGMDIGKDGDQHGGERVWYLLALTGRGTSCP
jgi:hypothetical protein